jgi:hypothetical protein
MSITTREIMSRLPARARAASMIAAALLLMAPLGALVSQEAPKPTPAPAQSPPAEKKAEQPAGKSAPAATKPAGESAKPQASTEPAAAGSESESENGESADAPKRFIPSQKSSADNSATFPIDI